MVVVVLLLLLGRRVVVVVTKQGSCGECASGSVGGCGGKAVPGPRASGSVPRHAVLTACCCCRRCSATCMCRALSPTPLRDDGEVELGATGEIQRATRGK
jgi:hypothetical protein